MTREDTRKGNSRHRPAVRRAAPKTDSERKGLWDKYRISQSTKDRNAIVEAYLWIAGYASWRFVVKNNLHDDTKDDLFQIGTIQLIKSVEGFAVPKFSESGEGMFVYMAKLRIYRAMKRQLLKWRWLISETDVESLTGSPFTLDPKDVRLDDQPEFSSDQNEIVFHLLSPLPDPMKDVIRMYDYEDRDFDEISQRLGISQQEAIKLRHKALSQLLAKWAGGKSDWRRTSKDLRANANARKYIGVYRDKRKNSWLAQIWLGRDAMGRSQIKWVGRFATQVQAARAHDVTAIAMFGSKAKLNFPTELPLRESECAA